ncbi:MAG: SAM-dependent methyltransferase, partial [Methanomicrobiales archaeon]|nr:SAM-dependent methyltransferase [Methanomicrobiales archaeon]
LQQQAGGNARIGRQLFPLLVHADFPNVHVSPRMVYVDSSRPNLVEGFTRRTFIAMVEGVGTAAVQADLVKKKDWEQGIRDLYRTADPDGVFCYTFFKAIAVKE